MRLSSAPKLNLILLVLILGMAVLCLAAETDVPPHHFSAVGCEPRLPLEVNLVAVDGDPSIPGRALALDLIARTDLASVRMELLLPEQVSLISGPRENGLTLDRGERRSVPVRVAICGAARIQVRITAVTSNGLVFQRGAALDLGADGCPVPGSIPGRLVGSPAGGRSIREFPARSTGEVAR